jgi:DNA helicase HerA-like ATPase
LSAALRREIRVRRLVARAYPDPFLENLPPAGALPPLAKGRIPLGKLVFGQVVSLEIGLRGTARNILVCGPTGTGKTNFLRQHLLAASGQAIIVVFDRKGDLESVAGYAQDGEVVVLDRQDVKLALLQVIPGMEEDDFIALITEVLAQNLHLMASRRLISDSLYLLFRRKNQGQARVSINDLIELVERIRVDPVSRLGQYREAVLFALKDLSRRSGGILDHTESNFLQEVFSRPRTFIIRAGSIPVDHLGVVVSLFYMFVYERRRLSRQTQPPVMIVVDDALLIATGSMEWETEGARNPIATWSFHGRSFNIGLVVSVQNFSPISPALCNNADTVVCLGSLGEDAAAVATHMNLNHDQSQELQGIPVGQAIVLARSVLPYAVRGWIPEVS